MIKTISPSRRRSLALLALPASLTLLTSHAAQGDGQGNENWDRAFAPVTLAVIGDTPYGAAQIVDFPNLVALDQRRSRGQLGGARRRHQERQHPLRRQLLRPRSPATSTASPIRSSTRPGDNEWTDCHRGNNGKYDPLERLAVLREMFFPVPGLTLGERKRRVSTQAERARASRPSSRTSCGSSRAWCSRRCTSSAATTASRPGSATTPPTPWSTIRRAASPRSRRAPPPRIDWIDRTFALARSTTRPPASPSSCRPTRGPAAALDGFDTHRQRLAERARGLRAARAGRPGRHARLPGRPARSRTATRSTASPRRLPNLTRVVVEGETTSEWLRLEVDPRSARRLLLAARSSSPAPGDGHARDARRCSTTRPAATPTRTIRPSGSTRSAPERQPGSSAPRRTPGCRSTTWTARELQAIAPPARPGPRRRGRPLQQRRPALPASLLRGRRVDLAVVTDRGRDQLRFYAIDSAAAARRPAAPDRRDRGRRALRLLPRPGRGQPADHRLRPGASTSVGQRARSVRLRQPAQPHQGGHPVRSMPAPRRPGQLPAVLT